MSETGLVYDARFLLHRPPHEHPEHPGRLAAIWEGICAAGLDRRCQAVAAREATVAELCAVHEEALVHRILHTAGGGDQWLDGDTYVCGDSAAAAQLAAGGLVDLTLAVWRGTLDNGLALLRPPGHHAEYRRSMGFCLFNNTAVAAHAARSAGAERVVVLDWDLHHGNGTQDIFWEDPSVLYVSTHQHPLYPGTGLLGEVGEGDGAGYTVNLPLPGGLTDVDYLALFDRVILPIVRAFDPSLILVSAGFDASLGDPLGQMRVTPAGFAQLTHRLQEVHSGKVVLALEGGYNLGAISASTQACLRVLLGEAPPPLAAGTVGSVTHRIIEQSLELHRRFWPGI